MRILLVDDHAVVRKGLVQILLDAFQDVEIGEASTAHEALERVREGPWSMAVLDIGLPDLNGLELLKRVKAEAKDLPVLVLSMHSEDQYGARMMKAGASGYLTKAAAPENLVDAVQKITAGGRYVSRALTERLAFGIDSQAAESPHEALSNREYQIFEMIASGETVSAIAAKLSLSVKTVSTHRHRILEKMGLKNNAELTHYAMERRLVE